MNSNTEDEYEEKDDSLYKMLSRLETYVFLIGMIILLLLYIFS